MCRDEESVAKNQAANNPRPTASTGELDNPSAKTSRTAYCGESETAGLLHGVHAGHDRVFRPGNTNLYAVKLKFDFAAGNDRSL